MYAPIKEYDDKNGIIITSGSKVMDSNFKRINIYNFSNIGATSYKRIIINDINITLKKEDIDTCYSTFINNKIKWNYTFAYKVIHKKPKTFATMWTETHMITEEEKYNCIYLYYYLKNNIINDIVKYIYDIFFCSTNTNNRCLYYNNMAK